MSCGKKVEHWFKASLGDASVAAVACGHHVDVNIGLAVMRVLIGSKSGSTASVTLKRSPKQVLDKELICGSRTEGRVTWEI
jgi:hypothetical protein